ncbi:hypothetical protein J5N97_001120 [Dioscorea zingiberensis]|uniref:Uncharacterized protein n=1 Tax=Dioscorea zingiberensis TaxID=325984 RepID=A0A9D5H385_9LILI|nr:hypothetical protein J5N97_001120 [Dioscorea zingiberensis]
MEALKSIYGSDSDDDARDGEPPMNGVEFKEGTMLCMFTFQMTKKMQIPLLYAEAIIGIEGKRISYIRNLFRDIESQRLEVTEIMMQAKDHILRCQLQAIIHLNRMVDMSHLT